MDYVSFGLKVEYREGGPEMGKKVFISHSSADADFAMQLCSIFEEEGLGCWIAPRDIPYGSEWAGEITEAIKRSAVMIFILTKNSNQSHQVVKEINTALQNNVTIIPIKLDEIKMNASLSYYLLNLHWLKLKDVKEEEEIRRLALRVKNYIMDTGEAAGHDADPAGECADIPDEDWEKLVNVDDELDARFEELFGREDIGGKKEEISSFRRKLLDRIAERVVENFASADDEDWDIGEEPESEDENGDPDSETDEDWIGADDSEDQEKYFTLTETEGADTLIFMVCKKIREPEFQMTYAAELLEDELEILEDGSRNRTYYLENPDSGGNPLILVTFMDDKRIILVNMGFCTRDIIRIGKKPSTMEFTVIENKEGKMKIFRANKEGKYIIDPETCKPVPRESYYDKKSGRRFYYMKLLPYKKYFAFEIISKAKDGYEKTEKDVKASCFDIAYGYYRGRYGLKQNMLNAAEWFEKAGDPEAYYYLGLIFRNDPLLADEEDAAYYMKLAFEGGEERAGKYVN